MENCGEQFPYAAVDTEADVRISQTLERSVLPSGGCGVERIR